MTAHKLIAGIAFAYLAVGTWAGPISFDDRLIFEALGTIQEFQDFESFDKATLTNLGNDFVDGSVAYTTAGPSLAVGADSLIAPVSNTLSYVIGGSQLTAEIGSTFTMLGLDMALNDFSGGLTDVSFTLFTNLATYNFGFALPEVQDAQLFQGFLLEGNEFFTGFEFGVLDFVHIDNVTLGAAVFEVPEPAVMFLLMIGMLSCGIAQLKQQTLRR